MADIKISELTTASQINNGDNIELSQDSGGGSLVSLKATILAVATKILKGINFTSDLQTTNKTIIGAINEAAQGGGGGSSSLAGLSDVDIDDQTLDDDQVLVWDSVNEKWVNADQSGQGGTTVVANPSGEATDDLLKVQIGSTIYDIPGGGSDSGSGTLKRINLYTATQEGVTVIPLSQTIENFDFIEIICWYAANGKNYTQHAIYSSKDLLNSMTASPQNRFVVCNDTMTCWFDVTDVDELTAVTTDFYIREVYGYRVEGNSALSGKSLVMKTKTWTGDGNNPCVLTFTEKPYAIFNIYGDGLNGEKVLNSPFIYGETSYYLSSYSNGILFNSVSYSNNDLTMTMSGVDEGAVFNVNGSQYTMWYLVEETFNEFKDITGTLEAGETSITLSDADITSDSTVQPFTDVFGLNPTNMVVANGSVTLTFDAQQSDVRVKVRISSNCAVPVTNLSADDIPYDSDNSVKDMLDVQQSYTIPTTPTDYGSFTFTRCGNLVQIEIFGAKVSSAQTYIEITSSLPSQFRPSKITYLTFTDNASTPSVLALLIYPSGLVRMYGYATTAKTYNIQDVKTYFV